MADPFAAFDKDTRTAPPVEPAGSDDRNFLQQMGDQAMANLTPLQVALEEMAGYATGGAYYPAAAAVEGGANYAVQSLLETLGLAEEDDASLLDQYQTAAADRLQRAEDDPVMATLGAGASGAVGPGVAGQAVNLAAKSARPLLAMTGMEGLLNLSTDALRGTTDIENPTEAALSFALGAGPTAAIGGLARAGGGIWDYLATRYWPESQRGKDVGAAAGLDHLAGAPEPGTQGAVESTGGAGPVSMRDLADMVGTPGDRGQLVGEMTLPGSTDTLVDETARMASRTPTLGTEGAVRLSHYSKGAEQQFQNEAADLITGTLFNGQPNKGDVLDTVKTIRAQTDQVYKDVIAQANASDVSYDVGDLHSVIIRNTSTDVTPDILQMQDDLLRQIDTLADTSATSGGVSLRGIIDMKQKLDTQIDNMEQLGQKAPPGVLQRLTAIKDEFNQTFLTDPRLSPRFRRAVREHELAMRTAKVYDDASKLLGGGKDKTIHDFTREWAKYRDLPADHPTRLAFEAATLDKFIETADNRAPTLIRKLAATDVDQTQVQKLAAVFGDDAVAALRRGATALTDQYNAAKKFLSARKSAASKEATTSEQQERVSTMTDLASVTAAIGYGQGLTTRAMVPLRRIMRTASTAMPTQLLDLLSQAAGSDEAQAALADLLDRAARVNDPMRHLGYTPSLSRSASTLVDEIR